LVDRLITLAESEAELEGEDRVRTQIVALSDNCVSAESVGKAKGSSAATQLNVPAKTLNVKHIQRWFSDKAGCIVAGTVWKFERLRTFMAKNGFGSLKLFRGIVLFNCV
jgi:hypothetical protein